MNEAWLAHHGVQGMKWGVRRFQNYDGSYTKKGLEHYRKTEKRYDEADAAYKSAKIARKQGLADDADVYAAKIARKDAKADMEFNYKQLKKDYLADQGKEMYNQGRRITKAADRLATFSFASTAGAFASYAYFTAKGETKMADLSYAAGLGASFVADVIGIPIAINDNKMREYYNHHGVYK